MLADRKIDNIRDLSGQIPNLNIGRVTISHTTQTYSLRGVGEADPIQEPVLAVYVDDVYIPRQIGSMVEFNDLERLEVLRGPQGTLYGPQFQRRRVAGHHPRSRAGSSRQGRGGDWAISARSMCGR